MTTQTLTFSQIILFPWQEAILRTSIIGLTTNETSNNANIFFQSRVDLRGIVKGEAKGVKGRSMSNVALLATGTLS